MILLFMFTALAAFKCPVCVSKDLRSKVYKGNDGCTQSLVDVRSYWDEDGKYVNPNTTHCHETYWCSLGHQFRIKQDKTTILDLTTETNVDNSKTRPSRR